jgi:pectinesterase
MAVAKEMSVPFIDLHTLSVEHHNAIGPEASMTYNPKADDMTHFNKKGAEAITELIIHELKAVVKDLNVYIKPTSERKRYDKQ